MSVLSIVSQVLSFGSTIYSMAVSIMSKQTYAKNKTRMDNDYKNGIQAWANIFVNEAVTSFSRGGSPSFYAPYYFDNNMHCLNSITKYKVGNGTSYTVNQTIRRDNVPDVAINESDRSGQGREGSATAEDNREFYIDRFNSRLRDDIRSLSRDGDIDWYIVTLDQPRMLYTPKGWSLEPFTFYDRDGNFYIIQDGETSLLVDISSSPQSINSKDNYSTMQGMSIRGWEDARRVLEAEQQAAEDVKAAEEAAAAAEADTKAEQEAEERAKTRKTLSRTIGVILLLIGGYFIFKNVKK